MIVKFEYSRELPTDRFGSELNVEMFLNQISKEVGIRDIKIFNIDGK